MSHGPNSTETRHLRTLFAVGAAGMLSDGQLLERFANRDGDPAELAFAALVERHGSMVLRVARGVASDEHSAHDVFQATFLILARKARSLWVRDSLGPWLHGVAYRVASQARSTEIRRKRRENIAARPELVPPHDRDRADLIRAIHEEIDRLPQPFRLAIVTCHLEGLTQQDAAARLGWPVGTLQSRLARGRQKLRDRLERRGLNPSLGVIASQYSPMPHALTTSTAKAAASLHLGKGIAGIIAPTALALIETSTKGMFMTKLKLGVAAVVVMVGGFAGTKMTVGFGRPVPRPAFFPANLPQESPVVVEAQKVEDPKLAAKPGPSLRLPKPRPWETVVRISLPDEEDPRQTFSGTLIQGPGPNKIVVTTAANFQKRKNRYLTGQGSYKGRIWVNFFDGKLRGTNPTGVQPYNGNTIRGSLLDIDFDMNLALIWIDASANVPNEARAATLVGEDWKPETGMEMVTVGCSQEDNATAWDTKILNADFELPAISDRKAMTVVECEFEPGLARAGGGLFNAAGDLAGVNLYADPDKHTGLYARPEAIRKLLIRAPIEYEFKRTWTSNLEYYMGIAPSETAAKPNAEPAVITEPSLQAIPAASATPIVEPPLNEVPPTAPIIPLDEPATTQTKGNWRRTDKVEEPPAGPDVIPPPAEGPGFPVLLDFHATWAAPCKQMRPIIARLVEAGYPIKTINIEHYPNLAKRYNNLNAVPTLILVDGSGTELKRLQGGRTAQEIARFYNENRPKDPEPAVLAPIPDQEPGLTESRGNPKPWETVVRIKLALSKEEWGFGSGTVISSTEGESIILTCAHTFRLKGQSQPTPRDFKVPIKVDLFNGQLIGKSPAQVGRGPQDIPGELIDYDFDNNVALIRIRPGHIVPASRVVPAHWQPKKGMKMTAVGCSHGADATAWDTRIVDPRVTMNNTETKKLFYEIKCTNEPKEGRSGGGLYTSDGYVAAVCNFADPTEHVGLYAVPDAIHRLLDRNGLKAVYDRSDETTSSPRTEDVDIHGFKYPPPAELLAAAGHQPSLPPSPRLDPPPVVDTPLRQAGQAGRSVPQPWETVVRIRVTFNDNDTHGYGSGTIIQSTGSSALILTSARTFRRGEGAIASPKDYRNPITVDLFDGKLNDQNPQRVKAQERDIHAELIDHDIASDLALLRISTNRKLPVSPVSPPKLPFPPMMLSMGCSRGLDPSLWYTTLLDMRALNLPDDLLSTFTFECSPKPDVGRNGGGLFSSDGYLKGVCSLATRGDNSGFYIALGEVHRFLDRNGLKSFYEKAQEAASSVRTEDVDIHGFKYPAPSDFLAVAGHQPATPVAAEPSLDDHAAPKPWETVVRVNILKNQPEALVASGVVVRSWPTSAYVLTSAHALRATGIHVSGESGLVAKPAVSNISVDLFDGRLVGRSPGKVGCVVRDLPAEVVCCDFALDLAVLKVTTRFLLPVSPLADSSWKPREGVELISVGCSDGNDATAWNTKVIDPNVPLTAKDGSTVVMRCEHFPRPGRSGGGLFTLDGYLAGIGTYADPAAQSGFYAPIPVIRKFLYDQRMFDLSGPDDPDPSKPKRLTAKWFAESKLFQPTTADRKISPAQPATGGFPTGSLKAFEDIVANVDDSPTGRLNVPQTAGNLDAVIRTGVKTDDQRRLDELEKKLDQILKALEGLKGGKTPE